MTNTSTEAALAATLLLQIRFGFYDRQSQLFKSDRPAFDLLVNQELITSEDGGLALTSAGWSASERIITAGAHVL